MIHGHKVEDADFTVEYRHDDSPAWHTAMHDEDHDHPFIIVLSRGTVEIGAAAPAAAHFRHADAGFSTVVRSQ